MSEYDVFLLFKVCIGLTNSTINSCVSSKTYPYTFTGLPDGREFEVGEKYFVQVRKVRTCLARRRDEYFFLIWFQWKLSILHWLFPRCHHYFSTVVRFMDTKWFNWLSFFYFYFALFQAFFVWPRHQKKARLILLMNQFFVSYQVSAVTSGGEGPKTASMNITYGVNGITSYVGGFAGTPVGNNSVMLTWTAPQTDVDKIDQYIVTYPDSLDNYITKIVNKTTTSVLGKDPFCINF